MQHFTVPIRGMHCASCEILVGEKLKAVPGVTNVSVNRNAGIAKISFAENKPDEKMISAAVRRAGYEVGENGKAPWISRDPSDYKNFLIAAIILFIVWLIAKTTGLINFNTDLKPSGLFVALIVGLIAGVSTCMALVGGLVLSLAARHAELHPEATAAQKFRPHIYFNAGRIIGYAVFGGIIGLVGRVVQLSSGWLGLMTLVIGCVMIFLGLKLIEIFPALKNKTISLPSWIGRLFGQKNDRREYSPWAAILSGALTFFLPCGFTQAMQLYAVSTGSFYRGAAIMGLFALGTAPGLIGIGGLSSIFKGRAGRIFFAVAGIAVIIVGWTNLVRGGQTLALSVKVPIAVSHDSKDGNYYSNNENASEQIIRMTQGNNGYSPNNFTVTLGKPVKWIINSTAPYTCSSSVLMPAYGINKSLTSGENIITFTPTAAGVIPFSCSMGMYRGQFVVVSDATGNGNAIKNKVPAWDVNN
jgi:Uncharacterized conserved protein